LLDRWTATVGKSASNRTDAKTIRHHWLEFAETLPQRAFTIAVETGWHLDLEESSYENEIHCSSFYFLDGGLPARGFVR
jgi:hypothetical protein